MPKREGFVLTARAVRLLIYIRDFWAINNYAPSQVHMEESEGVSANTVHYYMKGLVAAGYLNKRSTRRGLAANWMLTPKGESVLREGVTVEVTGKGDKL